MSIPNNSKFTCTASISRINRNVENTSIDSTRSDEYTVKPTEMQSPNHDAIGNEQDTDVSNTGENDITIREGMVLGEDINGFPILACFESPDVNNVDSSLLNRSGLLTPRDNTGGSNRPMLLTNIYNAGGSSSRTTNLDITLNEGLLPTPPRSRSLSFNFLPERNALPVTPFIESVSADELNTPPVRGALGDGSFPVVPSSFTTGALVRAGVRNFTSSTTRQIAVAKRHRPDPNQIAKIMLEGKVKDFSGGNFTKLTVTHVEGNAEAAEAFDSFLKETYAAKNNIEFYRKQSFKKELRIRDLQKIIAKCGNSDAVYEASGIVREMKRDVVELVDRLEQLAKQLELY